MVEIWKDIEGYKGMYQVSDMGRIRSFKKIGSKSGIQKKFRVLNPYTADNGRKTVVLCKNKDKNYIRVHRLVAGAFIPNPENKPEVNHLDGNQSNNCVENLEWSTRSENMEHAYRTGLKHITERQKKLTSLANRGEGCANSKLTKNDVLQIRSIYDQGFFTQSEIAESYNLNQGHVSDIINKKRWAWL